MTGADLATRPHVVYEVWFGDTCGYVGMTCDLANRLAVHRRRNAWHLTATEVRTTECPDRESAERLERERIAELRPANNVRGKSCGEDA